MPADAFRSSPAFSLLPSTPCLRDIADDETKVHLDPELPRLLHPSGQTQSTLYRLQWLSHGLIPYKSLPTHDQLVSPDDEDLAAGDLEWYYPRQTTTRDGYLVITLTLPSLSNLI